MRSAGAEYLWPGLERKRRQRMACWALRTPPPVPAPAVPLAIGPRREILGPCPPKIPGSTREESRLACASCVSWRSSTDACLPTCRCCWCAKLRQPTVPGSSRPGSQPSGASLLSKPVCALFAPALRDSPVAPAHIASQVLIEIRLFLPSFRYLLAPFDGTPPPPAWGKALDLAALSCFPCALRVWRASVVATRESVRMFRSVRFATIATKLPDVLGALRFV